MRPLWSGSIGFGLVNIPVKLQSATISDHGLNLDMLHKNDLSPIRFARICKADNKKIPWKDIVKGYELDDGKYVVLTDEDFQRANKVKSSVIEIEEFVQEKAEGKLPKQSREAAAKPTKIVDLFATLKASLKPAKNRKSA